MRGGRRGGVAGSVLLAAATFAGCATARPPAPYRPPTTVPSVAALDATLAARRTALHGLRALARLRYQDGTDTTSARQAIVVERPDRVRVEVLSLLGTVFLLVVEDGQLTAYARDERTVYRGVASPQNLARYGRIGLPIDALVDLLLATPPAGAAGSRASVTADPERRAVLLERVDGDEAYRVWFGDTSVPLAAEVRTANGTTAWRARFDDYQDVHGIAVATHVVVELPVSAQVMDVVLQDIDVNPTLDPAIFALQIPPGSRLVELPAVSD